MITEISSRALSFNEMPSQDAPRRPTALIWLVRNTRRSRMVMIAATACRTLAQVPSACSRPMYSGMV